jgi:AraC-like DNA-binding protein
MRYAEYRPAAALASIVERYWMLEGHGTGVPEPIIPDGRVEIVLHFGVRFERHHPDGRVERQAPSLVAGQLLAPISLAHRGLARVAGIRLQPAATRAVIRCSAAEMTGRIVDAEAVVNSTETIRERLALARDDGQRVRLLDAWLARLVRGWPARDVSAAVTAITRDRGAIDLAALAGDAGVSLRHLERRFLADVGMPPKTFARLVRLQSALRRIAAGGSLADVAFACGYYDQPHMTRDFNRLAETSPAAWRQCGGSLTPLFVGQT